MSWRRSFLSYKEKYEDTYSPPPFDDVNEEEKEKETKKSGGIHARISQCSSSSELKKRLKMKEEGVGEEGEEEKTRRKDDRDPVPETGFTIWDASLLLAAYLKREEKMEQFLGASAACSASLSACFTTFATFIFNALLKSSLYFLSAWLFWIWRYTHSM